MIKLFLVLTTISCYNNGISKLSNIFKIHKNNLNNEVTYTVSRTIKLNNEELFNKKFVLTRNISKETLIAKSLEGEVIAELKDKQVVFNNNQNMQVDNDFVKLVYNIFLNPSLELNRILEIIQVKNFKEELLSNDLIKVSFENGYLLYNRHNKNITKLVYKAIENNVEINNKLYLDYRILNNSIVLNYFKLQSKVDKDTYIFEEILEK